MAIVSQTPSCIKICNEPLDVRDTYRLSVGSNAQRERMRRSHTEQKKSVVSNISRHSAGSHWMLLHPRHGSLPVCTASPLPAITDAPVRERFLGLVLA